MKCSICGDLIEDKEEVLGLIQGVVEDDEIDVQETGYVHVSCYRDAQGKISLPA